MRDLIHIVGGRRNALLGFREGLPFVAFIAALYALAMLAPLHK